MGNDYASVMSRKGEIMKKSVGIDYASFESGSIAFDYERMMRETGYTLDEMQKIQKNVHVGDTPILELRNLTALARKCAKPGYGARIFIKDEAANPSGSFKARRAANAVYHAKKLGFKGVISATSGNYGAAVASQAAMAGLKCIVVQECYDSKGVGQPEIIEKARKCEALGAEVVQLTVGPELFYKFLLLLEETGYFNASLYTPFGIAGVETLGYELSMQFREKYGKDPDMVVCTNAGGGNLTGTARGLLKAGASCQVVGASVNLSGLHMASDTQFNKKSFTTGHTGFGVPFASWPDRSDVPRSAARPLRYMDRYVTISQGSVFYITEALASLEGLEKGPAGNTALAAAFSLAQQMPEDQMIVVQETEYTGAGKHVQPQLAFARENGIDVRFGDPADEVPGVNVILPSHPSLIKAVDVDLDHMRKSLIKTAVKTYNVEPTAEDIAFLAEETRTNPDFVKAVLATL
ncbi:MAG: PLP-dependent lyase/thiolase [Firmicutes bacterium]|nr:PLP-dependent lyase/thiolase [Clostridiales bacterium]MBQ9930875.1 PLP-dependent lyase/thiolase [Bacillota bacterium]